MSELLRTSLYEKHLAAQAKMVGFGGWDMPVQYEGIIKEYTACREEAALFDISHMGEFFFFGDIANSGINEAVSVDLTKLPVGKCKYGTLLNEDGGIIDDLITYRIEETALMFVVNASRREADFEAIKKCIKEGELTDVSFETSKIDIQGPLSKELLQPLVHFSLDELKFFSFRQTEIFGHEVLVSRTGYTGELGYELYMPNIIAGDIWDALAVAGAKPAGLGARDLLRLEMGYSLYGHELDETTSPLEAGLKPFVHFDHEFVGKEALLKEKELGSTRKIIAFETRTKRAPRHGFKILQNDKEIGVVTSGIYSPKVNSGIGLGYVTIADFDENESIQINNERGSLDAYVTSLPFYKKEK